MRIEGKVLWKWICLPAVVLTSHIFFFFFQLKSQNPFLLLLFFFTSFSCPCKCRYLSSLSNSFSSCSPVFLISGALPHNQCYGNHNKQYVQCNRRVRADRVWSPSFLMKVRISASSHKVKASRNRRTYSVSSAIVRITSRCHSSNVL